MAAREEKEKAMMRCKTFGVVLAIAALGFVPAAGRAEESTGKAGPATIRVTGESTVTTKPDQAEIDLGVMTQAATGQAAAAQNAQKQDAVLAALRKALGPGAEIKTINYSLSPNYRYPKEGGQPTVSGYTANNTIQVKTPDLAQVGKLIDVATQTGANTVGSLRFTLKDEEGAVSQALREAATKARAKADALASALKLRVVRVLQVDEGGQPIRPIYAQAESMRVSAASAPPTPVEAGNIEVQASVTLVVEIAP
jgi:hypothetical protein